jgi:hypothetical protein
MWKAYSVFTNLDDLKGFPGKLGTLRNSELNHGNWEDIRRREKEFVDADGKQKDPIVEIIEEGHRGLNLAARLKCLEVPTGWSRKVRRLEIVGEICLLRYPCIIPSVRITDPSPLLTLQIVVTRERL